MIIIILLVVALALALGVYFFFMKNSSEESPVLPVEKINKIQYIKLLREEVDDTDGALTMAELEAFDKEDKNVALNKPASSSSTYFGRFPANLGVDGKLDNFMHTKQGDDLGWFEVNLESEHDIKRIIIHNRTGSTEKRIKGVLTAMNKDREAIYTFNVKGIREAQEFKLE